MNPKTKNGNMNDADDIRCGISHNKVILVFKVNPASKAIRSH